MVLISVGELVARLADNRLTSQLRLDVVERLSRVALGWFVLEVSHAGSYLVEFLVSVRVCLAC